MIQNFILHKSKHSMSVVNSPKELDSLNYKSIYKKKKMPFKTELMDFVSNPKWIVRFSKKYNTPYFDYITFYYKDN